MGRTSKRLHRQLKAAESAPQRGGRRWIATADVPDVAKLIDDGLDPTHAGYVFVRHIAAKFAEGASQLPEMRKFAKIVAEAEDEYFPLGPPMSPRTTSFFTSWTLFHHRHDAVFLAGIPDLKATLPHA